MLILLARVDSGTPRITGAQVEDQPGIKCVRPTAAVVSTLAAAAGRTLFT